MPRRSRETTPHFDAAALRRLRTTRRLSLDTLGDQTGIGRADLISYEQGRRAPGIERLAALAKALHADPWDLTTVAAETATLADLRARAGLTKTAVAAHLGLARPTWDGIERGARTLQDGVAARVAGLIQAQTRELLPGHPNVQLTAADIQTAHQRRLDGSPGTLSS